MKIQPLALLALAAATLAAPSFAPSPALAHVVAAPGEAKAGSFSAVAFRVGHACGAGDATLKVRVEVPAGVASARPQPKPGWTLAIEKDGDKTAAVTWTGRLPDDQFDDFALLMKLPVPKPGEPQALVFPVIQTCEKGESQWTEIPDPERPGEKLTRPAPTVRLLPATEQPMPDMPGMKH